MPLSDLESAQSELRSKLESSDLAITDIKDEYARAIAKFNSFNSAHEGYAVILEELDELWEEVKVNKKRRSPAKMYAEAMQVAAMALRFMTECCGEKS